MSTALAATIVAASYIAARTWAVLRAQELYRQALPGTWWAWSAALAAVVGLVLGSGPALAETRWPGLDAWVLGVAFELALGTVLGLLTAIPGYAVLGAASQGLVALRVARTRPFVSIVAAVSLAGGFALGLHRSLLGALLLTSDRWRPGAPLEWSLPLTDQPADLAGLGAEMTILALALATPVLLCVVVADLASAWIARGTGDRRSTMSNWLRLALSMVALGASWRAYGPAWFV